MLVSSGRSTGGSSCGSRDIGPIPTLDAITAVAIAGAADVGGLPATAPEGRRVDQHARDWGSRGPSNPRIPMRPSDVRKLAPNLICGGREEQAVDPTKGRG